MHNFTTVPFKTETAHGLSQINGVAKFSSAGIILEYESKLFGIIANGVKEVRISVAEILDVRFRKGVFKHGAKIEIRTKTVTKLAELPNSDGKLTLKILRPDFERAQDAITELQAQLTGHQQELPPAHTPVSRLFEDEGEEETKELGEK